MAIINQWPMSETKVLGGGGPGMYSIVLPRSVYWASASEWVQVNSQQPEGYSGRQQVVCNGKLWVLGVGKIYAVDLASGETVDSIDTTYTSDAQYPGAICTDGERYIWFSSSTYSTYSVHFRAYQVDTIEKTVGQVSGISFSANMTNMAQYATAGCLVYSRKYDAVFYFGGCGNAGSGNPISLKINLNENTTESIANLPLMVGFAFGWSDEETGDIYLCAGVTNSILQYSPSSNTYTIIANGTFTPAPTSVVPYQRTGFVLGDTIYCVTQQGIIPFDPKTGETREGPVPTNPGFAVNYGWQAVSGNTLYLSAATGLYKCALYENIPEEAPIVAKIYKGQKYHTLQPFTIHGEGGDVNVTTTQQTAAADIPIKMYTYDNAGGQILIIENGGE